MQLSDIPTPIPDDEARQAIDALGGYAYQLYRSILAWIELGDNELLFVEVAEDYAIACRESMEGVQVKRTASNITLRSEAIVTAINAYWDLRHKNPDQKVSFRYLTTSKIGKEKNLSFPSGVGGLKFWRIAARQGGEINPLCEALKGLKISDDLRTFLNGASDDEIREQLICPIRWDCEEPSLEELRPLILQKLVLRGRRVTQANVREFEAIFDPLLARVLYIAIKKEDRKLSSIDLDRIVQDKTQTSISTETLRQLMGTHLSSASEFLQSSLPVDASHRPFPNPVANRDNLVTELAKIASFNGVLILQGGTGLGKSVLARLVARKLGGRWSITDFRGLDQMESNQRIFSSLHLVTDSQSGLILDDFPVEYDAAVENSLGLILKATQSGDNILIVTSSRIPSNRLFSSAPKESLFEIPKMSLEDVCEIVEALDGDTAYWGEITHTICGSGHPQLVHSRVKRLAQLGWPEKERLGGLVPQIPATDIDNERLSVRRRLSLEVEGKSRDLLYRLCVIGGHFDRQLALSVARADPQIARAGEALDDVIGPWVEPLGNRYFRLSPLLMGAEKEQLEQSDVDNIRQVIVDSIIARRPLEGALISTAFLHALACSHESGLTYLAMLAVHAQDKERREYISEQLFSLQHIRTDQPIFPSNLYLSTLLRLAQFQVSVYHEAWGVARKAAESLFHEISNLPDFELRIGMEFMSLSMVLMELHQPEIIPNWLQLTLRHQELISSGEGPIFDEARSNADAIRERDGHDISDFLFAINATRKSDVKSRRKLFSDLDALTKRTRDKLLASFEGEPSSIRLFISNAWLAEHEDDTLDAKAAASSFAEMSVLAENWEQPRLAGECVVAQSVMLDEYLDAPEEAISVLVDANKRLGNRLELARQQAKVLFRKNDHKASIALMRKISSQLDPEDHITRTYAFREAAMSATHLEEWDEAIEFYVKARRAAQDSDGDMAVTATGILGDMAGVQVRAGDVSAALQTSFQALNEIERFDPPQNDLEYCTRLRVGAIPAGMDTFLYDGENKEVAFSGLFPGICSSDPQQSLLDMPLRPLEFSYYSLSFLEVKQFSENPSSLNAISSWPDAKRIVSCETILASEKLYRAIRQLDISHFDKKILGYISSLSYLRDHSPSLRETGLTNPARGTVPILSISDIDIEVSLPLLINGFLIIALAALLDEQFEIYDMTAKKLREEFGVIQLCNLVADQLEGTSVIERDTSLSVAHFLSEIKNSLQDFSPDEIFKCQCSLFSWMRNSGFQDLLTEAFHVWVIDSWKNICDKQSFLLGNPMLTTPVISDALEREGEPLQQTAAVLLAAEGAVPSRMSPEMSRFFQELI